MRDFADVAGIEMDGDGKAVLELIELGRIERRSLRDLRQGLLASGQDPDFALAQLLNIPRQPIEIEDQLAPRRYVLSRLVNREKDTLPRCPAPT